MTDQSAIDRIPVDDTLLDVITQTACFAADAWTFGPDGPYQRRDQSKAETTRGQVREALAHLAELGIITINADRHDQLMLTGCPMARERVGARRDRP